MACVESTPTFTAEPTTCAACGRGLDATPYLGAFSVCSTCGAPSLKDTQRIPAAEIRAALDAALAAAERRRVERLREDAAWRLIGRVLGLCG